MAWKRAAAETMTWAAARLLAPRPPGGRPPRSIFVLRNNDLGDLLAVTPLFEALRRRFPDARIVAGVGAWAAPLLERNPHVDEIAMVNAPWFNRVTGTRTLSAIAWYVARSPEIGYLRSCRFDAGIDVLGSVYGSWLLMSAGIPLRLGVRGYAGGHTAAHHAVSYVAHEHVGRAALRFAELLGATAIPEVRPQVFLSPRELEEAEAIWCALSPAQTRRIVVAPGGGHAERRWPVEAFALLARRLAADRGARIAVIGGKDDVERGRQVAAGHAQVATLCGRLDLRAACALIARADAVFCNSSLPMHAAAASGVPAVVLLGPAYPSARAHAAQWGYGALTRVYGRDEPRSRIFAADEVLAALAEHPLVPARACPVATIA